MKILMFLNADFAPKKAWGVKFFQLIMAGEGVFTFGKSPAREQNGAQTNVYGAMDLIFCGC